MNIPAAIAFAIGLTIGTAAYAEQSAPVDIEDVEPGCVARKPAGNGEYDCISKWEPKDGKFYFMTWENNASVIVRGYPWMDNRGKMGRIDQPTDYRMCQDMVTEAWFPTNEESKEYFAKYNEIWCVKAGE